MSVTPPPPTRNIIRTYPGTPLIFNNNNKGNPSFHMYHNNKIPNTPNAPRKRPIINNNNNNNNNNAPSSLRKRKRTRINPNTYNSNNNNNNTIINKNYIRPQKIISNNVKLLRDECDEYIKQMSLKHDRLIDDLLRNKKNEIDNIDKKYKELINEINKKNEDKKIKILNECKKIEKTVKNQDSQRVPLKRQLFKTS